MHRGGLADPLDFFTKEIKKISAKRNKTEADHEEMARLEFYGGIYVDESGHPCLPAEVVEGTLINAAKRIKRGQQAKAGIICPRNFPLIYDGPKDVDGLWKDGKFRDRRPMTVDRKKVMRTRPMFRDWRVIIEVHYDPLLLNESEIQEIVRRGGEEVGFADSRPRFGRFIVEEGD